MATDLNERGVVGTQAEGGVTDISLANAEVLLKRYGCPTKITCWYDPDEWHQVEAQWDQGTWTFSGFGWGYLGSGPQGLATFLGLCGIDEPMEALAHNLEQTAFSYYPSGSSPLSLE